MKDTKLNLNWLRQLALLGFAFFVIFYHLIPFSLAPAGRPSPDILYSIICIFIIRRPEIVPFWMIVAIYFCFDIFHMRPLGVWTACMLIGTEVIRINRNVFRENLLPFEWFITSVVFLLSLFAQSTILSISFEQAPDVLDIFWTFIFTALSYPIILFLITYILRIQKPALGEFDVKGQKL